ncbi:DUF2065 domain-containing protein [Desulforhabdus amnigena]|jgi:uncharacterized protein YjeT (DUF2065 family)|nr:DUF2065 domain-containing protein [Desulforhabdus amnigena]
MEKILEGKYGMSEGYFFTVAGLICFFEGLPYFASPDHLKAWLLKVCTMSNRHIRILGGAMMVLGLLLVYWGRHHGG